jgi:hypothetical protein
MRRPQFDQMRARLRKPRPKVPDSTRCTKRESIASFGAVRLNGGQFVWRASPPVAAPRQAPPSLVVLGVLRSATARRAQSPLRRPLAAGRPVVRCFEDGAHQIGYCTIYAAILETVCFRLFPD